MTSYTHMVTGGLYQCLEKSDGYLLLGALAKQLLLPLPLLYPSLLELAGTCKINLCIDGLAANAQIKNPMPPTIPSCFLGHFMQMQQ